MKKTIISLILTMLALSTFSSVFVDVADAEVILESGPVFVVEDVRYSTNQTLYCSRIKHGNTFFLINNTGFNVTTVNPLSVNIIRIDEDFSGAAKNDIVLDFYATTTGGSVTFRISGMPPQRQYFIERDGLAFSYPTTTADGVIMFTNDQWSTRHFVLYDNVGGTGGDGNGIIENNILIYVYDTDNNPVLGALVSIYDLGDVIEAGFTDATGIFETVLDDGSYIIEIIMEDYDTLTDTIIVDGDETFTFFMTRPDYSAFIVFGVVAVAAVVLIYVYYVYYYRKSRERRA